MRIPSSDFGNSLASGRTDRLTLVAWRKGVWYAIATLLVVWMYYLFVYPWKEKNPNREDV
jgi:hypothetical protein